MVKRYLIIGSGPAGIKSAETIKFKNPKAEVKIITSSDTIYSPVLLMDFIANRVVDCSYKDIRTLRNSGIDIVFNEKVMAVDEKRNTIFTERRKFYYDYLIIATGAKAVVPKDIPERSFVLRTLKDAIKIKDAIKKGNRILIVGAGLIGLELADRLRGKDITIVEKAPHVLPHMLDAAAASIIQRRMTNVRIKTNTTINRILNGSVELSSGERIDYDIIIYAIGVKPNLDFIKGSQLKIKTGLVPNEFLQTSVENIYCCGDCVEHMDFLRKKYKIHANWYNAIKQAEIAAMNSCGEKIAYEGVINVNTTTIFGLSIFSIGIYEKSGEVFSAPERDYYEKYVVDDGKLVGYLKVTPEDFRANLKWCGVIASMIGKPQNEFQTTIRRLIYGHHHT